MMNKILTRFRNLSLTAKLCLVMTVLFIISLIPLLHLGLYAQPAGDDYSYGLSAHLAWESTHSLGAAIKGAIEHTKNVYNGWQGTYFSVFLMSLQPAVFSLRLYALTPVLMLGILITGHFLFFYVLFTRFLKLPKELWISLTLAVLFLSIQVLDSAGSAFYWFNGSVHYAFMHGFMLWLLAFFLLLIQAKNRRETVIFFLLSCLFAFLIGGSNFVTALLTPVLLATITFLCFVGRRKDRGLLCIVPLLFSVTGLLINVAAPGNAVRMGKQTAPMTAPEAIYNSFLYAVKGIGEWTSFYVLFLVLLLLPFIFYALYQANLSFRFPLPGAAAGFSFCLIAATYTPSLYSMGHVYIFERTLNIMRMFYYLLLFLNLVYLCGWLAGKCRAYEGAPDLSGLLSHLRKHCARSFCLFFSLAFVALMLVSDHENLTSLSATHSLRKGYAQSYYAESLNRVSLLTMEGVDEVWVPNFSVCPSLLNPQELSTDPNEYPNPTIAKWFGKKILHYSIVY